MEALVKHAREPKHNWWWWNFLYFLHVSMLLCKHHPSRGAGQEWGSRPVYPSPTWQSLRERRALTRMSCGASRGGRATGVCLFSTSSLSVLLSLSGETHAGIFTNGRPIKYHRECLLCLSAIWRLYWTRTSVGRTEHRRSMYWISAVSICLVVKCHQVLPLKVIIYWYCHYFEEVSYYCQIRIFFSMFFFLSYRQKWASKSFSTEEIIKENTEAMKAPGSPGGQGIAPANQFTSAASRQTEIRHLTLQYEGRTSSRCNQWRKGLQGGLRAGHNFGKRGHIITSQFSSSN